MNYTRTVAAATLCLAACPYASAQTCQPFWSGLAFDNPTITQLRRFTSFDNGSGPTVYVSSAASGTLDVARWARNHWEHLGTAGLSTQSVAQLADAFILALDDGSGLKLYAYLPSAAARWDGNTWTLMPAGFTDLNFSEPRASIDLGIGPRIYGKHRIPGVGSFVARWDGAAWQDMVLTNNNPSFSLVQFDDGTGPALYLFTDAVTSIAGIPCNGFAKWDGQVWSVPSLDWQGGFGGNRRFVAYDDGSGPALYTNQGTLGSSSFCGIMKWDGHQWSCFATPDVPPFTIASMNVLQVFDDGRGPALYISGRFDGVNGHPAHNLIRYDGQSWEQVGGGIGLAWDSGIVRDNRGLSMMINYDAGFSVGGGFVDGAVLWTGCALPQCYANCDNSTFSPRLNVLDFICFLNRYTARDPYANCTVDATIDMADFICFMNKFASGCP